MKSRIAALLLLLLLFVAHTLFAQSAAGVAGISGVVRDPSGAVVPGANVVISNPSRGATRTLTTNDAGLFTAPALVPGPGYQVKVTAPGFNPYEAKDLELRVGQNLDLHVNLILSGATTEVQVTATAPLVEDTKTDVSGVVDTRSIQDLPINGRRVDYLRAAAPRP